MALIQAKLNAQGQSMAEILAGARRRLAELKPERQLEAVADVIDVGPEPAEGTENG